jgi:cell division protein FtsQ
VHHSGFGLAELAADAGLRISNIQVNGAQATDPILLAQAIGVEKGEPSLGFSPAAVQQRVEQLGAVQTATVERELPGTLVVNITERSAFAIWQTGGNGAPTKFELIDKAGNVIADQDAAAAKRREPWLLLLVGADAPQNAQSLMAELQAAPTVLSHVAAAERVDGLRWNFILKNETVVKLPETGEQDAVKQLASLQSGMQLLDRPVELIDLRQPGRLVVRPYPAAATTAPKDDHT